MSQQTLPLLALSLLGLLAAGCGPSGNCEAEKDTGTADAPVDRDQDGYPEDEDCDDLDRSVHPGAEEVCNGADDDCDGEVDEDAGFTWYADTDGDGYGDPDSPTTACSQPPGHVADASDCDDSDPDVHPGASEACNGLDDDCDGEVDEDGGTSTYWLDADADGYGDPDNAVAACSQPSGYADNPDDCDDSDPDVHPGASETCNGVDDDCDGTADDGEASGASVDCPASSCADILAGWPEAADGFYWIDPDGEGAFEAYCDMTTAGGGWTLVASFRNDDEYHWTRWEEGTDELHHWTDEETFGHLHSYTDGDYKSPAFYRLPGNDLLALDSSGGWASYSGALFSRSLRDTLASYSSCQTTALGGVTVESSASIVQDYGILVYWGGDPNKYDGCAFDYITDKTDSSVIGLAANGCGTGGFGHLGFYDYDNAINYDADFYFCLANPDDLILNTDYACGAWHGVETLNWIDSGGCDYALLLVR